MEEQKDFPCNKLVLYESRYARHLISLTEVLLLSKNQLSLDFYSIRF